MSQSNPQLEDRSPVLLIALLFYFSMGPIAILSFLFLTLRGSPVNISGILIALFMSVSCYAAWRHRRWGYFGVLIAGFSLLIRCVIRAHALAWADAPTNLIVAFALALLAPLLLNHRLYLRRASNAA